MLRSSQALIDFIKHHEGFSSTAYVDDWSGTPDYVEHSIGYGHQIQQHELWLMNANISRDYAEKLLMDDLKKFEKCVWDYTRPAQLNQFQFDALVDLAYNIGCGAFKNSTVCRLVKSGNYDKDTLSNAFLMWTKSMGNHLPYLEKIRRAEIRMFFSDDKRVDYVRPIDKINTSKIVTIFTVIVVLLSLYFILR